MPRSQLSSEILEARMMIAKAGMSSILTLDDIDPFVPGVKVCSRPNLVNALSDSSTLRVLKTASQVAEMLEAKGWIVCR